MRVTISVDSATPQEVYDLTLAFQRSSRTHIIPRQITDKPIVTVAGSAMGWVSPALHTRHATALLAEYASLADTATTPSETERV